MIVETFVEACVAICPSIPYMLQYWRIEEDGDARGFSTWVCCIVLLANVLRLAYWIPAQYELTLLVQSLVMIGTQLLLLRLCVSLKQLESIGLQRFGGSRFAKYLSAAQFWRWESFSSYAVFLSGYALVCVVLALTLGMMNWFASLLGYAALGAEALLQLPQFVRNRQNKSTRGLSVGMVVLLLVGDIFKFVYFLWKQSAGPFFMCAIVQAVLDSLVLLQIAADRGLFKSSSSSSFHRSSRWD
jgi:solute carrier family 66, member 2